MIDGTAVALSVDVTRVAVADPAHDTGTAVKGRGAIGPITAPWREGPDHAARAR